MVAFLSFSLPIPRGEREKRKRRAAPGVMGALDVERRGGGGNHRAHSPSGVGPSREGRGGKKKRAETAGYALYIFEKQGKREGRGRVYIEKREKGVMPSVFIPF